MSLKRVVDDWVARKRSSGRSGAVVFVVKSLASKHPSVANSFTTNQIPRIRIANVTTEVSFTQRGE